MPRIDGKASMKKDSILTSPLPENWTVEDIEARLPDDLRKIKRVYRLTLQGLHEDGYEPEFFFELDLDGRDAIKARLDTLVKEGILPSYKLATVTVILRPTFFDTLEETLRKGR